MANDQSSNPNVGAAAGPCESCDQIREADHRIANHLALLAGYVRLKATELSVAGARGDAVATQMVLGAVSVQLDLIASLHRGFLSARPTSTVQLPPRLEQLCAVIRGAMGEGTLVADLPLHCAMAPAFVAPVTQVVAEALINAVKHGAKAGEAPRITVAARPCADGGLVIEVADHGPGLAPDLAPGVGNGLKLMRALCRQIGAELDLLSAAEGLTVRMRLPPRLT